MKELIPLVILLVISRVSCDCPLEQIHSIGYCSYRIQCSETIKDVKLDKQCTGSPNYDVKIKVALRNANDNFHTTADEEFLSKITTLTISANWPETSLLFLNTMYFLEHLFLTNCYIKKINGRPFGNLMYLETLDLSHNFLSDIEDLFQFDTHQHKMRKLSLAHNLIEEVPGGTFDELTSLVELDLSYNLITELSEEPFLNLTNLHILKLNNNNIKDINGAMNNLTNLRHLYLSHNQIFYIGMESLKTINHLQTFDISNNQIQNMKPIFFLRHWDHFRNHSICRIIISDNFISVIPNSTFYLFEKTVNQTKRDIQQHPIEILTELDLSKNNISHIEYNAFQYIGQLVSLDLSNNKLLSFHVDSKDLMSVKYLNLSCNYLTSLRYESFALMHNLQNLDLSHNFMDYFPDQSLTNSNTIKYINMTHNEIAELHSLRIIFHPDGGVLDLSNNGLSALSIPFNEAIGLRDLILSSNNITDAFLIKLTDQRDLTRLDMTHNFIQELDESSLQLPNTLSYLDLSNNHIQRIAPSAFHRVSHLKTLRLSHNQLKMIEYGVFRSLTALLNLDLSYNQIKELDSRVFMDLKLLSTLSLRYNGLAYIDHNIWLNHKYNLKVFLDGNDLSCPWLAKALNDYNNGYSKMNPTVLNASITGHSIDGIPCNQKTTEKMENYYYANYETDERLLITSQKILEAVQDQTHYLKKYIWRFILQEAKKQEASNNTNNIL
ncbi:unnamed protein product, partial [Brenthis ino]